MFGSQLFKYFNGESCHTLFQYSINLISKQKFTTSYVWSRHPGIIYSYPFSKQWAVKNWIDPNEYTADALPLVRTGGRGPDGKIKYKHLTTGLSRPWFMVDYNHSRHLKTGNVYEELVLQIKKNWWRHPLIALVASGEVKRWIIATTSMKIGDIICSHVNIPIIPVTPKEGDSYPVGALPVGTVINQIEIKPGAGAVWCRSAGASATIIRRGRFVGEKSVEELSVLSPDEEVDDDHIVIVRNNGNKKLLRLLPSCMVVVGQVSNHEHNQNKFRKFGEKYWHGIKQRSGLWQRKTGRFGRKLRPIGPPKDYVMPAITSSQFVLKCTLPGDPEFNRQKERTLYTELNPTKSPLIQPEPKAYNSLPSKQPKFRWCSWSSVR